MIKITILDEYEETVEIPSVCKAEIEKFKQLLSFYLWNKIHKVDVYPRTLECTLGEL